MFCWEFTFKCTYIKIEIYILPLKYRKCNVYCCIIIRQKLVESIVHKKTMERKIYNKNLKYIIACALWSLVMFISHYVMPKIKD